MRYHVNPENGNPYACKASKKPCPYGGDEVHFLTAPAARAAYEMRMHDEAKRVLEGLHVKRLEEAAEALRNPPPPQRPFLTAEQVGQINVDGIRCPHCAAQLTPIQASAALDQSRSVKCDECGKSFDLYSMTIEVGKSKDTYRAYDSAEVYKMAWYHSTTSSDWDSYFKDKGGEGFVAHLGSHQAALDRRLSENYASAKTSDGFWLYKLSVTPKAKIAEEVAPDLNEDYNDPKTPMRPDIVRYVNKYEDMASISLAAKTDSLLLLEKQWVTFEEAVESPSLYNVPTSLLPPK